MSKRPIVWMLPAVALLAVLVATTAVAEESAGVLPVPAIERSEPPSGTGCGSALELALPDPTAAATPAAKTCPAAPPRSGDPAEPGSFAAPG